MIDPPKPFAPDARGTEGERNDIQQGRADTSSISSGLTIWAESATRAERCTVVRRRQRLQRDAERSSASHELGLMLDEMYPTPERLPSTYGMSPDARRKYAAYLMSHGWQAYEVRARLAAPEVMA